MFLQRMRQVSKFTAAAVQLMHNLEQCPLLVPLPTRFILNHITITLASHQAAITSLTTAPQGVPYVPTRLNVTRATPDPEHFGSQDRTGPPVGIPPDALEALSPTSKKILSVLHVSHTDMTLVNVESFRK